jgi:hypothetical protein
MVAGLAHALGILEAFLLRKRLDEVVGALYRVGAN